MRFMRARVETAIYSALIASVNASAAIAAAPIYGGPTYSTPPLNGARTPYMPFAPGVTAGDGVGIGYAEAFLNGSIRGYRAYRWDVS